jgi:hypothetical protein
MSWIDLLLAKSSDKTTEKSFTISPFSLHDNPVSLYSPKQLTISFATLKAEYKALSDVSHESITRSHLYEELYVPIIYSDNVGALNTAKRLPN